MKIRNVRKEESGTLAELLVLAASKKELDSLGGAKRGKTGVLKSLDTQSHGQLAKEVKYRKFEGKIGENLLLHSAARPGLRAVLLHGITTKETPNSYETFSRYRKLGTTLQQTCDSLKIKSVQIAAEDLGLSDENFLRAFFEGFLLSAYDFDRYKSKKEEKEKPYKGPEEMIFVSSRKISEKVLADTRLVCEATILARDLVNMPPVDCTPGYLVKKAQEVAKKSKLAIKVFDEKQLKSMGANTLLAVAKGSSEPPYLIRLTYKPSGRSGRVVSLVGKGITFDSGGLSIKTAGGMETMKCDMAGAAAVIATMQAIAALKPRYEVRGYIPTCENMINGRAARPGDVVRTMQGKTVEILNTDAEGRLILADALALAEKEKCDTIIDLATLTGACMVALGNDYAGLFSDDQKLVDKLIEAGSLCGERFWRLPLAPEYKELIKSSVADIKNTGGSYGGAITAALFLKEFVKTDKWAHLDIAGPAFSDGNKGFVKKGGVGFGVRTLVRFLMAR